ncbi:Uncharacterised protein [Acinetobacter baumannii]|nr:Uncharacterised protein [Acinetobacter baumannii]
MVFRAVAHGVARVQDQLFHRRIALGQHTRHLVGHFLRRLSRHHQMQGLRLRVEPAVGVVRLQRRGVYRLRGVAARHYQPVGRRIRQLVGDHPCIAHTFLIQLAALAPFRPHRQVFFHRYREDRRVLQAGEAIVVERLLSPHPHIAEAAPGIALERAGHRAVFDGFFAEFQLVLGEAETGEVVIDQDRHRLAEIGRGFAARQQHVVTVERRKGQAVARQIFRRHQAIRLQIVPQQRQIDPFEQPVGLGHA